MLPKPNISLDEFLADPTLDDILEPPRQVLLRSTGEIEILKPLAYWEAPKTERLYIAAAPTATAPRSGFSWLHGSMIAGGALVLLGITFVGAVVLWSGSSAPQQAVTSEPAPVTQPVVQAENALPASEPAIDEVHAANPQTPADQPVETEIVIASEDPRTAETESRTKRPASAAPAKPATRAALQPRSRASERNSSTFTPSKTVIYVENGQVKKRIEPQSGPKK